MRILAALEDFVAEIDHRAKAKAKYGKSMQFVVAKTSVDALLPRELFAYPIFPFDESGNVVHPDGSEQRPLFLSINRDHPGSVQVSSLLSSILSTLHRQSMLEAVRTGRREFGPGFVALTDESDRSAGEEAERLIRASRSAGHVGPIVERMLNFGWDLSFDYRQAVRKDLHESRAAMRFFGAAYNELRSVRDAIDKVSYNMVGGGWRLAGGGEEVRTFLESHLRSMNLSQVIAQFTRDTQLLGTGCAVFTSAPNVRMKLVKPTELIIRDWIQGSDDGVVLEERSGNSWPLSEVMLQRGVAQEGSPYGLSVLEPAMPSIDTILRMKRISTELEEMREKIATGAATGPPLEDVRSRIDTAEETRAAAESNLERLFRFPETELELDRSGLYLPGQERWGS